MYYISVSVMSLHIPPELSELSYFSRTLLPIGGIIPITIGNRKEYGIVIACTDIKKLKSSLKQTIYTLKPIPASSIEQLLPLAPSIYTSLQQLHNTTLQSIGSLIAYYLPTITDTTMRLVSHHDTNNIPVHFYETDDLLINHIARLVPYQKQIIIVGFNHAMIQTIMHNLKEQGLSLDQIKVIHPTQIIETILHLENPAYWIIPYADSNLWNTSITIPYVNHLETLLCLLKNHSEKVLDIDLYYHTLTLQTHQYIHTYYPDYVVKKMIQKPLPLHWDLFEKKDRFLDTCFSGDTARTLADALTHNKTSVIMTHRTGMASSITCNNCNYIVQCETCVKPLSLQQKTKTGQRVFVCTTCRSKSPVIDHCPVCAGLLIPLGYTTEKIKQDISTLTEHVSLPQPVVVIADHKHITTLKKLINWITTITKNHHNQSLVIITTPAYIQYLPLEQYDLGIVISLEGLLAYPQYNQDDRVYTSIRNFYHSEQVIIQTKQSDHYLKQYLYSSETEIWRREQLQISEQYHYPPSVVLLELIINKPIDTAAKEKKYLAELLSQHDWIAIRSTGLQIIRRNKKTNHQYTITVYYNLSLHDQFMSEIYPTLSHLRVRRLS